MGVPRPIPTAKELSKRLKAAGFRFVGPTTVYAAMEACGIVEQPPAPIAGFATQWSASVLDERVRAVLERLEREDADERERGLPPEVRARQWRRRRAGSSSRSSRRRPAARCSRSAARAATRRSGSPPASATSAAACSRSSATRAKAEAWRRNVAEAGLEEWAELVEGDAFESLRGIDDVFDIVFIDAEKEDYEELFALARTKVEPGGLVIADNVLSHPDPLALYSSARQADPTLVSVTVPLDRGLELSVVLALIFLGYRGKEVVRA